MKRKPISLGILKTFVTYVGLTISFTACQQDIKKRNHPSSDTVSNKGKIYQPSWSSLRQHKTPKWFKDAKFGIFIHWGVYAVPGWAPKGSSAEWYPHNMYVKGSPTYKYHRKHYGNQSKFGYKDFMPEFTAKNWDPGRWAALFKKAGAKYIVPVAEHHDGFAMWDSKYTSYDAMDKGPKRDIIGELAIAVRKRGLKYAPSYHRARHWFYYPYRDNYDTKNPKFSGLYGKPHKSSFHARPGRGSAEPSEAFLKDWKNRWEEIRDKYKPDLMWFDGMWGLDSTFIRYDKQMMANYYNKAQEWGKKVGINNKGGVFRGGFIPDQASDWIEGDYMKKEKISDRYWQNPRPIGNSFGYNRNEDPQDYQSVDELVGELVDIVSKNGNLLLDIGPKADGTIPEVQRKRLLGIGDWLDINGEAIYGTRPWHVFGEKGVRFTRKGTHRLYVIALDWPGETFTITSLKSWNAADIAAIHMVGSGKKLKWSLDENGITIHPPPQTW